MGTGYVQYIFTFGQCHISPSNAPHIIIAISTVGGYFNLSGFCHDVVYVLRKSGYVDTEISLVDGTSNITMDTVGENLFIKFFKQLNIICFTFYFN